MKSGWMIVTGLAAIAAGLFYGWARLRSEFPTEPQPILVTTPGLEGGLSELGDTESKHLVSEETLRVKRELVERNAQLFRLPATDGETYDLSERLASGPVVLTYIKVGCPCSESAQPFFNRIRAVLSEGFDLGGYRRGAGAGPLLGGSALCELSAGSGPGS